MARCELSLENYISVSSLEDINCKKGMFIYIKKIKDASPYNFKLQQKTEESAWCELKLQNQDKLFIGCMYRSPNSDAENDLKINKILGKQVLVLSNTLATY